MKTNLPIQSHPSADAACKGHHNEGRTYKTIKGNQKTRKLLVLILREKRGDDLFSRSSSLLLRLLDIVTGWDIFQKNYFENVLLLG